MSTPSTPNFTPGNRPTTNGASAPPPPLVRPNIQNIGGTARPPGPSATQALVLDQVITDMVGAAEGVSDLLFVVGRPPQIEVYGRLRGVDIAGLVPTLAPAHVEAIALKIMGDNERLAHDLKNNGSCDTSYAVSGLARFRVNIFRQNGHHAIVMRKLSTEIPTCESLSLPPIVKEIIKEKTGIVFITGATGSGKTTTLAAMLHEINQQSEYHIVTLEDPIEFLHPHLKSTLSQRELGKDFPDFATGLRAALRQAPKVILVGEIRDRETMEIALTAAETGHIVFSTLHTISAAQSINRVIGMFANEEEAQVRQRLADTLRYVVSQRLVPKIEGGRIMVSEIMGTNLRTREAILLGENELRDFHEIIESSHQNGWHTFEQTLLELFRKQTICEETAMLYSVNKPTMRKGIDTAKKHLQGEDRELSGFRLNLEALHLAPGAASHLAPVSASMPPPLPKVAAG